jgi:AraC-like DNA-binding protein
MEFSTRSRAVTYAERPTGLPGVVLWTKDTAGSGRILPDGCVDLLWDGSRLTVAGPDTRARWHTTPPGTSYVALRLAAGTGPALLGVPAHLLRDRSPALEELWPERDVRRLAEQVAAGGAAALTAWARATRREPDPLGARVLALAAAGTPVAVMADRLGLSPRQLHRRCLPVFGYGPRHLSRVLRLERALAARARSRRSRTAAATPTRRTCRARSATSPGRRRAGCGGS